jgi:hypothetical protein
MVSSLDVCGSKGAADREGRSVNGEFQADYGMGRIAWASGAVIKEVVG